jgi:Tfp pilus assembly pilus retraction ATPase PilT
MKTQTPTDTERFRNEKFYTRAELSKKLRVTSRTIIRWEELGFLKPRRFGRMVLHAESDVVNYIYNQ